MNAKETATERWRTHTSAAGLTWGVMLDGAPAIEAIARHVPLAGAAILEIGPGYGRLLRAMLKGSREPRSSGKAGKGRGTFFPETQHAETFQDGQIHQHVAGKMSQSPCLAPTPTLDFGLGTLDFTYVGLDISEYWVRVLTAEFGDCPNVEFIHGAAEDAETLLVGRRFDVIVSLLTWKHLYPDFGAVALCCQKLLAADGRLIFDVPETGVAWPANADEPAGTFEQDTGTFTRTYARAEIESLLDAAGLAVMTFDEIEHTPGKRRLLVVAAQSK